MPRSASAPGKGESPPLPVSFALCGGVLMGAADAVPGVSGGTIALLLGIYERFIAALAAVLTFPLHWRDPAARARLARALRLLLPLGVGLACAYLAVLKLLVGKADDPGWLLRGETAPIGYAVLFGVVLASVPEPWRRLEAHGASVLLPLVLGTLAAFSFTILPYRGGEVPTPMLLLSGAAAISVMLLPGISGSLLLVVLGHYQAVSAAFLEMEFSRAGTFLLGIALGVGLFVPLLRLLLKRAHDPTMGALTGLMVGSLAAVWPFKDNYVMKAGPMRNVLPEEMVWPALVAALLAFSLVRGLLAAGRRRAARG